MRSSTLSLWAALSFTSSSHARLIPTNPDAQQSHAAANGLLPSEGVTTLDGFPLEQIVQGAPEGRNALPANAKVLAATGWTATADSYQPGNEPGNAIDGNANTFWHTPFGANGNALPHYITIDMQHSQLISSISYQPRQDGNQNGNIGGHTLTVSQDGHTFTAPKLLGTWRDDKTTKISVFEAVNARYVKLTSLTEAGNRGPWSSAAEINIYTTPNAAPNYVGIGGGEWSPTIDFPIVPVSAALEYNTGNVLVWSSFTPDGFGGSDGVTTFTATFYPGSQTVSQRIVTNTTHDMFCPGLNADSRGRVFVTGGNSASKTSIYTPSSDSWAEGPQTKIARGYAAQTTLSDGRTFLIGGSWAGGTGGKNGEVYSISHNAWTLLPGCPVQPMLTADAQGTYRADNHAMLFGWKQGWVFQAGPSKQMNWYNANGNGGTQGAGNRGGDGDAMCGIAAMFDAVAGKILVAGGAPSYQNVDATSNANIITLGTQGQNPTVQGINSMYYQRIFANSVIMPNGNVMITGGQIHGAPFSDDTSQLTPELYVQRTGHFIKLPPINAPRNYHSIAILLPDATIFAGGGGLCGTCTTNHYDAQVYSPGYLFNNDGTRATRPVINSATATVTPGATIVANTNGGITDWSMMRLSSTTHTVNTDQRRIPLTATAAGNTYSMVVPHDYGIILPGYYMLFAMNAAGVPSLAKFVFCQV